jgi:hypothetical protein
MSERGTTPSSSSAGDGPLNSEAIKKVLDEIQSQNEGTGDYFAQEEQRLLVAIAKQREAVRDERARGSLLA